MIFVSFVDAVRDVRKYTAAYDEIDISMLGAETQLNMKLFRSQRNLYIAGFALFLWLWVLLWSFIANL